MKTYRPVADLLDEVDELLAQPYSPGAHPLQTVLMLLLEGRHYTRVELDLEVDAAAEASAPPPRTEIRSDFTVPLRIGTHSYGQLRALHEEENAFGGEDRMLLKKTAARLAHFLATSGKYILFRARQFAAASPAETTLEAAAGDNRRS